MGDQLPRPTVADHSGEPAEMVVPLPDAVAALATVADAAVMLNGAASALASMGLADSARGCKGSCDALRQAHSALAAQARDLAVAREEAVRLRDSLRFVGETMKRAHSEMGGHDDEGVIEAATRLRARIRDLDGDAAPLITRVREALYADETIRADFESLMSALRYWQETARGAERREAEAEARLAKATRFDMGDGVIVFLQEVWFVKRLLTGEVLTTRGRWRAEDDHTRGSVAFKSLDAALAALAVSRD